MGKSRYSLEKKSNRGFRGYPIATIAFYGPTDSLASKVVVAIFREEGGETEVLERFFSEEGIDVRFDEAAARQVLSVIESHTVQSVIMADRIIGCPHEEGIDYPEGASCPQCPFWAGRDRWIGERIH